MVAKMGASLDRISGGRLSLNIVNGWNVDEFNIFGNGAWLSEQDDRYTRMDEYIQIIKRLWTEDCFDFDGRFYQFQKRPSAAQAATESQSADLWREPLAARQGYDRQVLRPLVRARLARLSPLRRHRGADQGRDRRDGGARPAARPHARLRLERPYHLRPDGGGGAGARRCLRGLRQSRALQPRAPWRGSAPAWSARAT